jgi:EAL and modified HD-GYP domain-containing signal transduction protein
VNYIELLNLVNSGNFELTKAADVISRDTALVIELLKIVNRMARNSEITSIRHAAAMLGQKELKRWINTAVAHELYADKPNEITRVSLIRAKFAENLAAAFGLGAKSSELFLMGLFSVLDVILDRSMKEALDIVKVSKDISDALIDHKGKLNPIMDFVLQYEAGNWQEVSRQMIIDNIEMSVVNGAYLQTLQWYKELISGE